MKKQVKNLFALFLTASMAVSLVPADAFAAVHDAVKDATTTTAYEKVEAERKAAQPKAGSAEGRKCRSSNPGGTLYQYG